MNNTKDPSLCRVRTITAFVTITKDKTTWKNSITQTAKHLGIFMNKIQSLGYTTQSLRIVTNPFGEYLNTESQSSILKDMELITEILSSAAMPDVRIRFAIGEAKSKQEISYIPALIKHHGDLANICINVQADELGVPDYTKTLLGAQTIQDIMKQTKDGLGNFNFTVNYNCQEYIPYFPASFHSGNPEVGFVLGFESPDLLLHAIQNIPKNLSHNEFLQKSYTAMQEALQYHVDQILPIVEDFSYTSKMKFLGIDSSAAPSKDCTSLVDIFRALGVEYFGAAGSVQISALLTRVFKSIKNVPLVGFSGLMLAATEDAGLAQDAIDGKYDIRTFLTNSAVCGIGLDTVPIEGNTSIQKIAAIMQDTGTLAYRLKKPLTVRLFPVPGKTEGNITEFTSDDLCNCAVFKIQ
jgi:uncharacterized protein (UPF0210 family)